MRKISAYQRVYNELKRSIKSGAYTPGMFLPTEAELEKQFDVSRTTVRRAISLLSTEGYLSVKQGRGTEVMESLTSQKLNQITSFTETLTRRNYKVTTQGFCLAMIDPPMFLKEPLELKEGERLHHLQRVQCADGKPICIMDNYIRSSIVPALDIPGRDFVSLYRILEEHGLRLKEAVERITAVGASFIESQILRVAPGTPLLYSTRLTYCDRGPFECVINKVVADQYEYTVYLTGRA